MSQRSFILGFLLFFCLVPFYSGCGKGQLQSDDCEVLVVEGFIEDGGNPVVLISTSVLSSQLPVCIDSLDSHIVRWARVKINDGRRDVYLTGMRSKDYFPPYKYTTTEIVGEPGTEYVLSVDYGTAHATASATIPESVPIDDILVEAHSDSLSKVYVQFTDPADMRNWYRLFVASDFQGDMFFPSLFGLSDDSGFEGQSQIRLRRGYSINMRDYQTDFKKGETIRVKLATCTEQMYQYWMTFDNDMFYGRIPFFPPKESMKGNISGAKGYWAGYGVSYATVNL